MNVQHFHMVVDKDKKKFNFIRYEDKLNFVWLPPIPKTCLLEEKKC